MRIVTPNHELNNMDAIDYLEATVLKMIMALGKIPTPSYKDIVALRHMGEMLLAIKKNNREEYALLLKSGIKDDTVDKKVLKEIEKLLLAKGGE